LRSVSGLYLGRKEAFNVDLNRLGRVVGRIVRGLYYHESGETLPLEYSAAGFFPEGFSHLPPWDLKHIVSTVLEPTLANPGHNIGRGVLHYWFARSDSDARITSWIFHFYRGITCLGATLPPTLDADV